MCKLTGEFLHEEFQAGDIEIELIDVVLGEVAHSEGSVGVAQTL